MGCFGYSVKARALLFAHLSRVPLPKLSLHQDRLYIVKKCPYLIHEMVSCISQLILLAHAGRIARLPSLDTVEATMKCSSLVVQALWDKASPLLQLPHVEEDMLKHFHSKRRNIKSLKQLAKMGDEDRRSLLRSLTDEQYKDLMKVLAGFPELSVTITTEVVDDETQHVVTAGSIVTVTIMVERKSLDMYLGGLGFGDEEELDDKDEDNIDDEEDDNLDKEPEEKEEEKKKGPTWKKPQQKKKAKKPGKQGSKPKPKSKAKTDSSAAPSADAKEQGDSGSESDGEESENEKSDDSTSEKIDKDKTAASGDDDNEEEEWARFQKGMNRREKALAGKSRVSHSVHCPYYTDDKQEFWWVYISDRKSHSLITPPYHLTSLVNEEEVELKFTAPAKEGVYNFTVCVRSDSYLGVDLQEDIKLDVQKAWEAPKEHKQWEFTDDEEDEDNKKDESDESEYAEDSEFEDDSD